MEAHVGCISRGLLPQGTNQIVCEKCRSEVPFFNEILYKEPTHGTGTKFRNRITERNVIISLSPVRPTPAAAAAAAMASKVWPTWPAPEAFCVRKEGWRFLVVVTTLFLLFQRCDFLMALWFLCAWPVSCRREFDESKKALLGSGSQYV